MREATQVMAENQGLSRPEGESHAATFGSMLLFLGHVKMSAAALWYNLSYKNPEEMLTQWQTAVLLSEEAIPLIPGFKGLSSRLTHVFRHVKTEWLRDIYVLMKHARSEADALNAKQLGRAIASYIAEGLPFPHQEPGQGSQAPDASSDPAPSIKRIRVTMDNRVVVTRRSADWLLNLCQDPVLMNLKPKALKRLMSTCRQLRAVVHLFVTTLKFGINSSQASPYDLQTLSTGDWRGLQVLVLQQTLDAAQVFHVTQGQLPLLTSLKLSIAGCQFAAAQLAVGNWPLLQNLNLYNSRLTMPAMAALKNGSWPALRQLILHNCRLESQAIVLLTHANWHELELLDLRGNDLDSRDIASLSLGMWPSLKTLHAGNIMEPNAWTHLLAGQWPELEKLTLTARWASVPATTSFPRVDAYSVGPHSGLPALKHFQIYQPRFCQSLAASIVSLSWQRLRSLDLTGCGISGAALRPLRQAHWPLLTELNLSYTDIDAAGFKHVVRAKMPQLQHLRLEKCHDMGVEAFGQLHHSHWPQLRVLALNFTLVPPEYLALGYSNEVVDWASINCVTPLIQADWPKLERLELAVCEVTRNALKVLVKGKWPALQHLDLSCSGLEWFDLRPLRGKSKQTMRLGLNRLRPSNKLAKGLWPNLCWLNLSQTTNDWACFL